MKIIQIVIAALLIVLIVKSFYPTEIKVTTIVPYEYQIVLNDDSISIWNNHRFVGNLPYDSSKLSELMIADNE